MEVIKTYKKIILAVADISGNIVLFQIFQNILTKENKLTLHKTKVVTN
jgi:hypothetical protein